MKPSNLQNHKLFTTSTLSGAERYWFGFNGKENINEINGWQDYGERMYNRLIGRFPSPDPIIVYQQKYPELTPYQFASNNPIWKIELEGLEGVDYTETLNKTVAMLSPAFNVAWSTSFTTKSSLTREVGFTIYSSHSEPNITNVADWTYGQWGGGTTPFPKTSSKTKQTGYYRVNLKGLVHTHPYDNNKYEGVSFSAGDISILGFQLNSSDINKGYSFFVEAGSQRFALVIEDMNKALAFFENYGEEEIQKIWDTAYKNNGGTFQENVDAAVKAVIGSSEDSGIGYYSTIDTEKQEFKKQN